MAIDGPDTWNKVGATLPYEVMAAGSHALSQGAYLPTRSDGKTVYLDRVPARAETRLIAYGWEKCLMPGRWRYRIRQEKRS